MPTPPRWSFVPNLLLLLALPLLWIGAVNLATETVPENDCRFEQACGASTLPAVAVMALCGVASAALGIIGLGLSFNRRPSDILAARIIAAFAVLAIVPAGAVLHLSERAAYNGSDCHRYHEC